MTAPCYDTPLWADFDPHEHAVVYEKPSPLRVTRYNGNIQRDIPNTGHHRKYNTMRHSQIVQGDGSLTVTKRRKIDAQPPAAEKENLRTFQHSPTMNTCNSRNMHKDKC